MGMKPLALLFGYPAYYTTEMVLNPPVIEVVDTKPEKPKRERRENKKLSDAEKIEFIQFTLENSLQEACTKFNVIYNSSLNFPKQLFNKTYSELAKLDKLPEISKSNPNLGLSDSEKLERIRYAILHKPIEASNKYKVSGSAITRWINQLFNMSYAALKSLYQKGDPEIIKALGFDQEKTA